MDDGARRWLFKTARKNYWRVSAWYDLDDLIQEGYVAYYIVLNKYPRAVDPPHRMGLFRVIFLNRLHDLANARTHMVQETCESDLIRPATSDTDEFFESPLAQIPAEPSILEALSSLSYAPQYVRDALKLFASEDGLRSLRAVYRKVPVGEKCPGKRQHLRRETLNERMCRLTGYDPAETDIVGGIRACLAGE